MITISGPNFRVPGLGFWFPDATKIPGIGSKYPPIGFLVSGLGS